MDAVPLVPAPIASPPLAPPATAVIERDRAHCRNCGAELLGPYCMNCGQAADVHVPHTRELLHEVFEGLTHSDSRLWRSLKCLWFKPGTLTREYVAGKRVAYLPPFRLYLVLSVMFFLIASLSNPHFKFVHLSDVDKPDPPAVAESTCSNLELTAHPEWTARLQHTCTQVIRDNGASLEHLIVATMPKALFIFLPLVALLHMLMYWRPRHRYAEHVIFFLHLNAFFFSVATVLVLSGVAAVAWPRLRPVDHLLSAALLWSLPVYTLIAIRRVFQRSWFRTTVKLFALVFIYMSVLVLTMTGVFVYAALQL